MLGFPVSTDFNKRIPKQKFYENLDVTPAMRRIFVEQIKTVFWKNKLAATTLNIAAGEAVTEIEVLEVRLTQPQLDESVLRQIDRERSPTTSSLFSPATETLRHGSAIKSPRQPAIRRSRSIGITTLLGCRRMICTSPWTGWTWMPFTKVLCDRSPEMNFKPIRAKA